MTTGVISAGCIVLGTKKSGKRLAKLAAACTLAERSLSEYQAKTLEVVGEKKVEQIKDAIAKDKIETNPVTNNTVIMTGKGETLCYESITGQYFKSDIEKIRRLANDLNYNMRQENYIKLNEWLVGLGLNRSCIGEDMGWHIDCSQIDVHFSTMLTEDGTPCLVIGYYDGAAPVHLDQYLWGM